MTVTKRSVSIQPDVCAEVIRLTGEDRAQFSALVNEALRHYLRIQHGLRAAREWEAEFGALTPEEIAEADRILDAAHVGVDPA
jgi:hypothetical protein